MGTSCISHHLCHPARMEANLDLFALTLYLSTLCKNFTYSLSVYICQYLFSLLVQGKACSLLPNPGEGLGVPADSLPDHQAEPQDTALHMTYRKGSWPDLSVICTSLFLFFCVSVISDKNQSMDGFPSRCTVLLFMLCGLPPLESSRGALWFSGLGVQKKCSLPPSPFVSFSVSRLFLWIQSSLGKCVFYFGGSLPPQRTHVVQMSVERGGWDFIILCTPRPPQSNMEPPGQMPTTRWQKLKGKIFIFQLRWD